MFYFLKRLELDLDPGVRELRFQQIVLINRDEVYTTFSPSEGKTL